MAVLLWIFLCLISRSLQPSWGSVNSSPALRDFGILQGAVQKHLTPVYLPEEAFAYLALYLYQRQPSDEKLLGDPEWQIFFLSRQVVEQFFF